MCVCLVGGRRPHHAAAGERSAHTRQGHAEGEERASERAQVSHSGRPGSV